VKRFDKKYILVIRKILISNYLDVNCDYFIQDLWPRPYQLLPKSMVLTYYVVDDQPLDDINFVEFHVFIYKLRLKCYPKS